MQLPHKSSTTFSAWFHRSHPAHIRSAAATSSRTSRARWAAMRRRTGRGAAAKLPAMSPIFSSIPYTRSSLTCRCATTATCMETFATARSRTRTSSAIRRRIRIPTPITHCRTARSCRGCSEVDSRPSSRPTVNDFRCCCSRTVSAQPDLQRLHRRAEALRESRLYRRRAVPWRLALRRCAHHHARRPPARHSRFPELHGDAGGTSRSR